jgi:hypothetical protein
MCYLLRVIAVVVFFNPSDFDEWISSLVLVQARAMPELFSKLIKLIKSYGLPCQEDDQDLHISALSIRRRDDRGSYSGVGNRSMSVMC